MPTRRTALAILATAATLPLAAMPAAAAPPAPSAQFTTAWTALTAGRTVGTGRLTLDVPRLAESGNSVALKVAVDSPMTAASHVTRIHILSEQNPIALVGRFHLGPEAALPEVETHIRLATTQNVRAVAEMSDGTLQVASAEVVVLLAACLDSG